MVGHLQIPALFLRVLESSAQAHKAEALAMAAIVGERSGTEEACRVSVCPTYGSYWCLLPSG